MKPSNSIKIAGLLLALLVLSACSSASDRVSSSFSDINNSGKLVVAEDDTYDWGGINIKGGNVSHIFMLKNDSSESLYLKEARTSCICTTARYKLPDDTVSPKYSMHNNSNFWAAEIKPNESFEVEVVFDPLAHGPNGTGAIQRSIQLVTSASNQPITELKVEGVVLSEKDYEEKIESNEPVGVIMGDFVFGEKEFDLGTIKQSGGIVSHDFAFTYTGEEPIAITGVVGSCACTEGEVSVSSLKKGDKGVLTVHFDPNLHEEPDGRFFKTVILQTNPKLDESPEVKIWTEIDLDLGPEAFKLQAPHDDDDDHDDEDAHDDGQAFHTLKPAQLKTMLENKDFFLLDVHIPEQEHIPGTDAFIDYREVTKETAQLPQDKYAKIVVYCRSGSMSRAASAELSELGYTNIFNLEGGVQALNSL